MGYRTNYAQHTAVAITKCPTELKSESITFKEPDGAGPEPSGSLKVRPLPALLSRRGFFLEPLAASAGAGAGAGVLALHTEGSRLAARRPPSGIFVGGRGDEDDRPALPHWSRRPAAAPMARRPRARAREYVGR